MTKFVHLTHSLDFKTGGLVEAVNRLNDQLGKTNFSSFIKTESNYLGKESVIAHGLWQWPSYRAWKNFKKTGVSYVVFPHGMLDPWFKRTYPIKHLKKQIYWWLVQGKIMRDARAVCFTTEEER